jgi:hypothetical protein
MKTVVRSVAILVLMLTGVSTSDQLIHKTQAQGPAITSIGGYTDNIGAVVNGRWTGQPSWAPLWASNKYKGYLAIDTWEWSSNASSIWEINGSGFGTAWGSVWLDPGYYCPCQFSVYQTISWSNTKIRVRVVGMWGWAYATNVKVYVRTSSGATTYRPENIVAAPKGRGYGQCTWEVFFQRKNAGLAPPSSAYPGATSIGAGYIPKKWDVLFYNTSHTGRITSTPVLKTYSDGKKEYTFTITERNANWDEAISSTPSIFVVKNNSVLQKIAMKKLSATHFWR